MIPPKGAKTFTSPASLVLAHKLRKRADAVLTGSGTVLADAPEFTVRRVVDFAGKRRFQAILDRRGRVQAPYLQAAVDRGFQTFIATDIAAALRHLGDLGALEVLVEAGPAVLQSVQDGGFWDEWITIEQGATKTGADRVTVKFRQDTERKGK